MLGSDLLKNINGLENGFSFDSVKKEFDMWSKEPELVEAFEAHRASFNSQIAITMLPVIVMLGVITLIITEIFNRFNIGSVSPETTYCYVALVIISALSYIIIYSAEKKEPYSAKRVNWIIYGISTVILIWMFILVYNSSSVVGSLIIYTATISAVTQTLILPPAFSEFYIFGGVLVYALMHIFDGKEDSFETDAILGMAILSVIWFMVVYMRYYSSCKSIYSERIISNQNEQLDEIITQLTEEREKLEDANTKLERAYVTDRLTGAYNRWQWDVFVNSIAEKCVRENQDVSVIMIDLDNFKIVNDTYGHSMGDECLVAVAQVIKDVINGLESTELFRLGGEEFGVISASFDKAEVLSVANRILKDITNIKIENFNSMLTASIGVYIDKISSAADVEKHLSKADAQMYDAKTNGKNRISFSFE